MSCEQGVCRELELHVLTAVALYCALCVARMWHGRLCNDWAYGKGVKASVWSQRTTVKCR